MNVLLLCTRQLFNARQQQLHQRDDFLKAQGKDAFSRVASALLIFLGGAVAVYGLAPETDRAIGAALFGSVILLAYIVAIALKARASQLNKRALSDAGEDVDRNSNQLLRDMLRTEVTACTMNYYNASVITGYEGVTEFWKAKVREAFDQLKREKDEPQWSGDHASEWEELAERCRAIKKA